MSSTTGVIFSYAIGLIFAVGGVLFLLFLSDNRVLFGVPYLVLGLLIIIGVRASQRRRRVGGGGAGEEGAPPA